MTLYRVRMHAARSEEFPEGSKAHGYDFVVPLDKQMRLDPDAWKNHSRDCRVHRFWSGEEDQRGLLRHIGRGWVFDYDEEETDDNEPFFKLDRHEIKEGEYLSVKEQDGETRTFQIVSVQPYVQ
ncbi:conserved protein [Tepidicaulis marinus]|jgi:hypothetical protein|uniref:Conserved protein n=1 Tax=Tepidicaulis marinus TaxID=1333998 RepID=A0A081BFJ7_9HYPH|nr:hypothetical protein [Tepidicaulis marinus]GAK46815.1 conserved protein [Tepidicaulis marinus]